MSVFEIFLRDRIGASWSVSAGTGSSLLLYHFTLLRFVPLQLMSKILQEHSTPGKFAHGDITLERTCDDFHWLSYYSAHSSIYRVFSNLIRT
jgi:hypothetical protein